MERLTIKDIARLAGVSPATVSRVINNVRYGVGEKTRDRIAAIVQESGYHPNLVARSMVTKRSSTIGLIVPDITNPFYALLVKGVEDVASRLGYGVVLCNSDNRDEKEYANLSYLKETYVAGIIYNNYRAIDGRNRALLEEIRVPVVYVDNQETAGDGVSLHVRQKEGMAIMTRYLLDMGHRRFAYLAGPKGVYSAEERLRGFLKTLQTMKVAIHPSFIKYCDYSEISGYEVTRELWGEKKKFTCLVCANDLIAYGATLLLTERGVRLPDDVSITGYDDIPFSKLLNPALTTIYHPVQDMGRKAMEIMAGLIRNDPEKIPGAVLFEPFLVKRNSVRFIGLDRPDATAGKAKARARPKPVSGIDLPD